MRERVGILLQPPPPSILTVLHLCGSPANTLRASITMRPAMMALVVAMAGTMLPAIAGEEGRE